MADLRLLEHYYSTQGEGPRVGIPTQFVRFAGCNLRCPAWPCDTPYAIEPKLYRSEQIPLSCERLYEQCLDMRQCTGAQNICLTGGEPILQNRIALEDLVFALKNAEFSIEMFSNGTIPYSAFLADEVSIVMDWKLPGSGEHGVLEQNVVDNWKHLEISRNHAVKFTVADVDDLMTALRIYKQYDMCARNTQIFVGPVWEKIDPAQVVDFIRINRLNWRLNLQVHKYVWHPEARGT